MHTFSFKSGVPVPDHLEQCVLRVWDANAVWVFFLDTFELKMPGLHLPKRNNTGNLLIQLCGASSV